MPLFTDWNAWVAPQKPCPPIGNPYATIALVGEAPGEREMLMGQPFVGEAGRLLTRLLTEVGIPRESVFLDNVVPFRPPNNQIDYCPQSALETYSAELWARLSSLPNLNLIVPLGNTALVALTGKVGISKWRGSLLSTPFIYANERQIKVLPTYHPSFLFRDPTNMGQALHDWGRIKEESTSPKPVRPPLKREFIIYPTASDLDYLENLCVKSPLVSLDIESNTKTREIICLGVAPSPTISCCIPWEKKWLARIKSLLASSTEKTGHFAALFDNFWLSWFGYPIRNLTIDTMFLHHCLDPSEMHSLAAVASLYTVEPYWKDEAIDPKEGTSKKVFAPSEATFLYNCKDAAVTHEIAGLLTIQAEKEGKWDFYQKHYQELFPALLSMMLGGIRVDRQAAATRFLELTTRLKEIEGSLETLAGVSLIGKKALSNKKKAEFLYGTLSLPKKWTKGENLSGNKSLATDEKTIRKLLNSNPTALAASGPLLLEHARLRQLSTFFSPTRIETQTQEVGEGESRFYFTLKPSTKTGRLASSKSPFGTGANAQNLDRECKTIYLPEPGHLLLELDASQVESRICYMLTGDPELVKLANTKPSEYDAHKENAVRLFEVLLEEVTTEQRFIAKIAVHSAQRAGTGKTLQETLLKETGVLRPERECNALIQRYYEAFPGILSYFREIRSQVVTTRQLTNIFGRTLTFPWDRFNDDLFRQAYSFPMQSNAADWLTLKGIIPLHKFLQGKKSRLLAQVHDSLLISVYPSEAWAILSYIIPLLESPLLYPSGLLSIPMEITLGRNWGEKAFSWKKPATRNELEGACLSLLPLIPSTEPEWWREQRPA